MILTIMIVGTVFAADPSGSGTLAIDGSERANTPSVGQLPAQGGNVTEVDITAEVITSKWAGYYGNITGLIVLEDSSGNTFYNWSDASPTGEVFATRNPSTPTWGSIGCADAADIGTEATALGLSTGADNLTNTFCATCGNHSAFQVSSQPFTADLCTYRSNVYDNSGDQIINWDQIILDDGNYPLYTTIINQDTTGFDGRSWDFQLLVAENSSISTMTNYFFYIEIA